MARVRLAACALLAGLALPVWAQAPDPAPSGYTLPMPTPEQVVQRGIDRLTGFLIGAGNPSPENLRRFLDQEVAPRFDFAYMAQWSAGHFHRRLNPDQQARLAAKLQGMFLDALARNLGSYLRPLPRVDVLPARPGPGGREANVDAIVMVDPGFPVRLQFRLYLSNEGWRVFDVSANGASAVAYYRGYFGNLFRRYGPEAALR